MKNLKIPAVIGGVVLLLIMIIARSYNNILNNNKWDIFLSSKLSYTN